ncbi:DNA repair protein [Rufibacter radiotolerans]|uniref:DNA repair protein n=1 Tax=Rufibacter radiotolerans TaxID=1379910 RepID=A0A0H4VR60_9BACT|nr:JAB domain-containing protein [Rufibacter radiotolerans]AKQ46427.1 DNA repair protein [Rufibacter radiotolerans]
MRKKTSTVQEIRLRYAADPKRATAPKITSSQDSYVVFKEHFDPDYINIREEFQVLYLNAANQVLGVYRGFSGGITASVVDVRLIMAVALKGLCSGMVIAHNHPSGNLTPSSADKQITQSIKKAGELFNIKLLDHLILTPSESYYSFADEGIL